MFSHCDDQFNYNITRVSGLPTAVFLYLGAEVLIAALIGILLGVLALIQSILPRPPRDLKNDTVVVTGAGSGLGKALAEEFCKAGCIVACIDKNLHSQQQSASNFTSQYQRIEDLEPRNDFYQVSKERKIYAYECNSANRAEILDAAKQIHRDIGHVDVLITCPGDSSQNILDTVSTNLMSHYWTMLAFIPSMIQCKHSHIVAVIPSASTQDAYMGSKAAVAVPFDLEGQYLSCIDSGRVRPIKPPQSIFMLCLGLVEAIGQHFSNASQLTFTTLAPKIEPRLVKQTEQQTARDIVEAVRRDQRTLTRSWISYILYPMCCTVYGAITSFTEWLYKPGYENLI